MANVSKGISPSKTIVLSAIFSLLAACTQNTSNIDTALQPQAAQPQAVQTAQTTTENALAADGSQTPAQTVTEAQLQGTGSEVANAASQTQTAALDTSNALTFLPVEGAPQTAITSLSKSIRTSAQQYGLTVLPATQTGAKYQVKGYFSALNDGSSTLLVYVWDVLDQTGKRVHRINGQERSGSSNSNPWLAIEDEELSRVADRTTARLKSWVDQKKG